MAHLLEAHFSVLKAQSPISELLNQVIPAEEGQDELQEFPLLTLIPSSRGMPWGLVGFCDGSGIDLSVI